MTGAAIRRTGGPAATAAPKPLEWTGEAAPMMPITIPSGGGPPEAIILVRACRTMEATNSVYSSSAWAKTPRSPELPPEARHTYRPNSSAGSVVEAARCRSTRLRVSRRSVTTSSKAAIIWPLVIVGSRGKSASSKRLGSSPRSRRAWNGECSAAWLSSTRSRSRWKLARRPGSQVRRSAW